MRRETFFNKFHQQLFRLLILLLPVQLGKHFWPRFSFVYGLPIDYLAPTLCLTDLIIIGILVSWGIIVIPNLFRDPGRFRIKFGMTIVIILLILNVLLAQERGVAGYYGLKLMELFLLGCYVVWNKNSLGTIQRILPIPMLYSSLIALAQFCNRGSLGGFFYWLGERTFTIATPGIASFRWGSRLFLRPYASFSHPNVLAGFLLIGLIIVFASGARKWSVVYWPGVFLSLVTLLVTFSKTVWLTGLVIGFGYLAYQFNTRRMRLMAALALMLVIVLFFWLVPFEATSFSRRFELAQAAVLMVKSKPLVGMGLGNFISQLPYYYQGKEGIRFFQPVHNLFLLVAAETGLTGLGVWLWFLLRAYQQLDKSRKIRIGFCVGAILLAGLFDHYWLTLQQGQVLMAIVMGLAWSR